MLKSGQLSFDFDDGGGREAAADRPWSNDSKGFFVCDGWTEQSAPMSAAVVEGTDADDTKSRERIRCPRRWTDGGK